MIGARIALLEAAAQKVLDVHYYKAKNAAWWLAEARALARDVLELTDALKTTASDERLVRE